MKIPLTIMTYKRSDYFKTTLESFIDVNHDLLDLVSLNIVIQGDPEKKTLKTIESNSKYINSVVYKENEGIGPGFTFCMRRALKFKTPFVFHMEDDWESGDPIKPFWKEIEYLFKYFPKAGYLRLRNIKSIVCVKNRYRTDVRSFYQEKRISQHIISTNLGWSWNPGMFRSDILTQLLPLENEKHAAKKYGELQKDTARLVAGCFNHIGIISAKAIAREEKKKR